MKALVVVAVLFAYLASSAACVEKLGLPYYPSSQGVLASKGSPCQLNLRFPNAVSNFPTVVWFHGGGLTSGNNRGWLSISEEIAQVSVAYRLMSETNVVRGVTCIQDAAAAVCWTLEHIATYGGNHRRVYLSGHSAGAYLALMVGMDPKYLARYGHSPRELAGLVPISGQVSTHFNIREFGGDVDSQYLFKLDDLAPLRHCSREVPPILSVCGQVPWEWPMRNEENRLLIASCRAMGHRFAEFVEIPKADHAAVGALGLPYLEKFILGELPCSLRPELPRTLPVFWGPAGFGVREGVVGLLASASIGEIDFEPYEYLSVTSDNSEDQPIELTVFPTCTGESLLESVCASATVSVRLTAPPGRTTVKIPTVDLLSGKGRRFVKRLNFMADVTGSRRIQVLNLILER